MATCPLIILRARLDVTKISEVFRASQKLYIFYARHRSMTITYFKFKMAATKQRRVDLTN